MKSSSTSSDRLPGRLWFALLGAPAAWGAQLVADWIIVDFGCRSHGAIRSLSPDMLRLIGGAITVAALAVALLALWIGIRAWRGSQETRLTAVHASERPEFMATVAMFVSGAFTLGILLSAFGPAMLPGCEQMR